MPDYNNGKIYKIIDSENKVIYIGSTTEKLCNRYAKHKHKAIGNKIILIELCPCNSREELVKREQELIEQYDNLLNKFRAYRTEEEYKEYDKKYREANKNKILEKAKLYRETNKVKISEKKKEQYQKSKEKILEQRKEQYQNNKDKILEQRKEQYQNNKNKILEKMKVNVICECGCTIRKYDNKHKQSKKHIKLMNTITK